MAGQCYNTQYSNGIVAATFVLYIYLQCMRMHGEVALMLSRTGFLLHLHWHHLAPLSSLTLMVRHSHVEELPLTILLIINLLTRNRSNVLPPKSGGGLSIECKLIVAGVAAGDRSEMKIDKS